jgi:demethylmenaquinone methyltransferase/2-methoxy-6-polyprenyl-1,4-benzoquinol methylase
MPLINHFDLLAPLYDRLIRTPEDYPLPELAELPISGRALDAGGGTGRISATLVPLAGAMVVADESVQMLRQTQDKDGLLPVGSEIERMPFRSDAFERIIVVDALHHFRHQNACLRELYRVLARGGLLVIEEPDIRHFPVKLIALAEKIALFRSHFLHAESVVQQLQMLGATTQVHRQEYNYWIVASKA